MQSINLSFAKKIVRISNVKTGKLMYLSSLFVLTSMLELIGLGLLPAMVVGGYGVNDSGHKFLNENWRDLIPLAILFIFSAKFFLSIFINRQILEFSLARQYEIRMSLLSAYFKMKSIDMLGRNSSEFIQAITINSGQFANKVLTPTLKLLSDFTVGIFLIAFLLASEPMPTILLFLILFISVYLYQVLFRKKMVCYGVESNAASESLIKYITEGISSIKELKIYRKESFLYERARKAALTYKNNYLGAELIGSIPKYILEFCVVIFLVISFLYSKKTGDKTEDYFSTLIIFGFAGVRLLPIASSISSTLLNIRFSNFAVNRLYKDLFESELGCDLKIDRADVKVSQSKFQNLKFDNVAFQYPGSSSPVFKKLDLEVKAGEMIGIVGESGSGKSTLIDLLIGFLSPSGGQIFVNGMQMSSMLEYSAANFAYIPQSVFVFDDDIERNVTLSESCEGSSRRDYMNAIKMARLQSFLDSEVHIKKRILGDKGKLISGGQKQRIVIARAFFHSRSVFILDEATSALDEGTEHELIEELNTLKGDATFVIVSHRMNALKYCDRIYEVKAGNVSQVVLS